MALFEKIKKSKSMKKKLFYNPHTNQQMTDHEIKSIMMSHHQGSSSSRVNSRKSSASRKKVSRRGTVASLNFAFSPRLRMPTKKDPGLNLKNLQSAIHISARNIFDTSKTKEKPKFQIQGSAESSIIDSPKMTEQQIDELVSMEMQDFESKHHALQRRY